MSLTRSPRYLCEILLRYLGQLNEAAIHEVGWRDFESHCATVLEENGYRVLGNVWFRDETRRYQMDIVAVLLRRVICIDCKAWTKGGGSSRARMAAQTQRERTMKLKSVAIKGLPHPEEMSFFPMVVTLKSEDVVLHEGVAIVPFEMLNTFVVNFDSYEAELFRA
ncbi:MAG: NERD domain-containing protein [Thermodesulfobacteriota bacterium]